MGSEELMLDTSLNVHSNGSIYISTKFEKRDERRNAKEESFGSLRVRARCYLRIKYVE